MKNDEILKTLILEKVNRLDLTDILQELVNKTIQDKITELMPLIEFKVKDMILNNSMKLENIDALNKGIENFINQNSYKVDELFSTLIEKSITNEDSMHYVKWIFSKVFTENTEWHTTRDIFENYLKNISKTEILSLKEKLVKILENKETELDIADKQQITNVCTL